MTELIVIAFCYLIIGVIMATAVASGIRPIGYFVGALLWFPLLCVDGTPRIRPFLRWARGEKVIEQSEWPVGVLRMTIQRRDGSEYSETNI